MGGGRVKVARTALFVLCVGIANYVCCSLHTISWLAISRDCIVDKSDAIM